MAAVCGVLAFAMVSCGDYTGKEKSHPLFAKAKTCKTNGNYKDAAKYYEDFLLICPKSANTHLELASLYSDNLDEPIKAVYHYQTYLELAPQGSADEASVRTFITVCKKKALEKLQEEYKVTPETEKLNAEVSAAKAKLNQYVEYAQKLKAQNEEMKKRLFGGKASKAAAPASPAGTTQSQAAAPGQPKPKVESYKTKAGDTFESISKSFYGSTSYAKLLKETNKSVVASASGKLKPGATLKIPALPPPTGKAPAAKPGEAAPSSAPTAPEQASGATANPAVDAIKDIPVQD